MKPSNDNFLAADVANLEAEIHALLQAYPDLADDEDLRRDCIEGETDAFSVLTRLVSIERDADAMAKARAARIADLQSLKARAEKRKEFARAMMLRVMRAGGIKKAPLVEATVSIQKGRDSVEITDEAKLPKAYVKVATTPDKTAIKAALDAGKTVKGAQMKTGEETLSVRAA